MKVTGFFRRRKGVALVITLSALVLLTVLILAFFSRAQLNRRISFTSTNQVKAEFLARSALDLVVGELRQELDDSITSASTTDGILMTKQGVAGADPDLGQYTIFKTAQAGVPLRPGGSNFGSSVKIDTTSLNGRNKANWFSNGPSLGSASLPTWAYMTRGNGVKVSNISDAKNPRSKDFVVGRFTYTVYDTGGLLDANVAGSPTSLSNVYTAYKITKGSIAYADLAAVGLSSGSVDSLVNWRNASIMGSPAGDSEKAAAFDEWATGIARTGGSANQNALNSAWSSYDHLMLGDNAFLSRRDLMRFSQSKNFGADSVGYLSHFSMFTDAPSWAPTTNEGAGFMYADDAKKEDDNVVNRDFNSIVVVNPAGINLIRYRDDGTVEGTDYIGPGEPLVQRKFSLAKLAWIGHDGPNPAAFHSSLSQAQRATAIKTAFGLTWDASNKRWNYNHGDSQRILTLNEICRNQERAPDFFELLKAGILRGSLGNHPGAVGGGYEEISTGPAGSLFDEFSENRDRQILQIGANIIDQADANNYPTAIYQNNVPKPALGEDEFFNTVFGQENLPFLQRISLISAKTDGVETAPGKEDVWMQPEVWNPYESSTADRTKYPLTPDHLRMVTYGGCAIDVVESNEWTDATVSPTIFHPKAPEVKITKTQKILADFGCDPRNPKLEGIVPFINPAPGVKVSKTNPATNFFDSPAQLTGYNGGNPYNNYQDTSTPGGPKNYFHYRTGGGTGKERALGVWLGEFDRDPRTPGLMTPDPTGGYPTHTVTVNPADSPSEPHLTFVLEYKDNNNQWRPYSVMSRLFEIRPGFFSYKHRAGEVGWFLFYSAGRPDPRTDRFSASSGGLNSSGTTYNYMWAGGSSVRAGPRLGNLQGGGRGGFSNLMPSSLAGFVYRNPPVKDPAPANLLDDWARNLIVSDSNPHFWYSDPDGVVRPGDSFRADYAVSDAQLGSGDGAMLYDSAQLPDTAQRRRPVILNRPFRSVAELGYVFRDQPFRSLDFWSDRSGDAGLLDLFAASGTDGGVRIGKVNPNSAPPKVLQSMLSGTAKQNSSPMPDPAVTSDQIKIIQAPEAEALAVSIANEIILSGGLKNGGELSTRLSTPLYNGFVNADPAITLANRANKGWAEAPLRSLAEVSSTRNWNLLVDVAAQAGRIGGAASGLEDFLVEGERRYWLHLSIDRVTGEVLGSQLEAYND